MSVLSNVAPNLVLASSDSPNSGYPDFRELTANDLPQGFVTAALTTSINLAVTNNHEIIVVSMPISSNTLKVGDSFRITFLAEANGAPAPICNVKFGTNGTTSDPIINQFQGAGLSGGPTFNNIPVNEFITETLVTCRSVGSSGSLIVGQILPIISNYANNGYTLISAPVSVNTQANNFLTFTVVAPAANLLMGVIRHL